MAAAQTEFLTHYFGLLTEGKRPYPWQIALYAQMIRGYVPDSLDLPTGGGKTSIIPIWLIALAWTCANDPAARLPRRLVWVVNRRVVVDQATEESEQLLRRVEGLPADDPLRQSLTELSGGPPLAVSALRGERADDGDWKRNPAVPAIVVGTVDMIGSRLLFRGYGNSRYWRPYDAGLLAVDCLIVNDEAHLTPAFARLLLGVRAFQPAARTPYTFRIMLVSATGCGLGDAPFQHDLKEDLAASPRFRNIYEAEKRLWLESVPDQQTAHRRLVALALDQPAPRTIVFVEEPEKALEAARQIEKEVGAERVRLLTGTMRGMERDELAGSEVFQAFQRAEAPEQPHFLVATSAAEVGVNLTSERMITIIAAADHLLQRFGRLNRFGDQDGKPHVIGEAWVVFVEPKERESESPRSLTVEYLRALPAHAEGWRDISCRALRECPPSPGACEPEPATARLEEWRLDVWAQTSIPNEAVAPVAPWLHGKQENEPPETAVTWRAEAELLAAEGVDPEDRRRAIEKHPIVARERIQEPTKRVRSKLEAIAAGKPDVKALLVTDDGRVEAMPIRELVKAKLAYAKVVLPPGCGGLERGMLSPETSNDARYDVADPADGSGRRRYCLRAVDGQSEWTRIGSGGPSEIRPEPPSIQEVRDFAREHGLGMAAVMEIPNPEPSEEVPAARLVLFAQKTARGKARREVSLDDHTCAAERQAGALGGRLLGAEADCLKEAARVHDQGKAHPLWQRAMGGDPAHPKAKTAAAQNPRLLAGFRHELYSLLLAGGACDLVLHLIGSHHGWGRPHWEARAYAPEAPAESECAALEGARRFGRLQAEYGHWGLAYREAVFKAIDGMASRE